MALFEPLRLGGGSPLSLSHRIVLAPLTRQRAAEPTMAPRLLNREYYSQRATRGGLLISEATNISCESCGYHHAPGIFTEEQVRGWSKVTEGVHEKGALIFCQLWHIGRISHPSWRAHPLLQSAAALGHAMPSVSASAVKRGRKTGNIWPKQAKRGLSAAPRALRTDEIPRLVEDYVHAARCALRAGFDGVEVHAAHGYLLDQFLNSGTNQRTDRYGGTIANRCRLLFEVTRAVIGVWGPGRVAVRLSPASSDPKTMRFVAEGDEDPEALYTHAVAGLDALPLAYLQLTEPRWNGSKDGDIEGDPGFSMPLTNSVRYRPLYGGVLLASGGFVPPSAKEAVENGSCDLVGFGRWFISNPDLPVRIKNGVPLNRYVRDTFYSYGAEGYVDYPSFDGAVGTSGKYALIEQHRIGRSLAQAKL